MVHTIIFDEQNKPDKQEKQELVDFLHDQLEQYGDPKAQIERAIDYSLKEFDSFGGFVMLLKQQEQIRAAVVINRTGMDGYIPENILVYIAVDRNSIQGVIAAIERIIAQKGVNYTREQCVSRAMLYSKERRYTEYISEVYDAF